jgi:predicted dehydrogenase
VNIGIIGCGLIGAKRAAGLGASRPVAFCDTDRTRAERLSALYPGSHAFSDWRDVVTRSEIDAVVVATTNDSLAEVASGAALAGKHVIVEKPGGRSLAELQHVADAALTTGVRVHVGFNHRFHPAFQKAREICDRGDLGSIMYVRGRYGHGGRVGYEREWRANPALSGGGELIDQGVHLIDLSRWFMGDFPMVNGFATTYFWDMPVDDNAFLSLRTSSGSCAWLHVSCSEWKNLFSFEIYGRLGKLHVDGLGGSYGLERLAYYRMLPEMGPPETTIWEYPGGDRSWLREFEEFERAVATGKSQAATIDDAMRALEIVERIYANRGQG